MRLGNLISNVFVVQIESTPSLFVEEAKRNTVEPAFTVENGSTHGGCIEYEWTMAAGSPDRAV